MVYEIIRSGKTGFDEIRQNYVIAAQQYAGSTVSKRDIQDSSLRLALLSLIEAKLISYSIEGDYLLNAVSTEGEQRHSLVLNSLLHRETINNLANQVIERLRTEGGRYTVEELQLALKPEALGMTFLELNGLVQQMIAQGVLSTDERGKLWLRSNVRARPHDKPNPTLTPQ